MKAILRVATSLAAAALAATSTVALAQAAPASNSTSPEIISAPELQNFSLKGTVTRPADVTPAPAAARSQPAEANSATAATPRPARVAQRAPAAAAPAPRTPVPQPVIGAGPTAPQPVMSAPARANATQTPGIVLAPAPAVPAPAVDSAPANHLAPFRQLPLWPWILAAIALLAGGAFLLWRRWPRRMAVAGPQFDLLVPSAPEPQPESLPRSPAPVAEPASAGGAVTTRLRPAVPSGVVASRLRPTLELGFHPLRCQVDDDQVAIEFELELFNAGTAPARAVLAEASMLNASVTQDQELAAFFSKPNGSGERLAVIQPLKRVSFRSQVVAPRNAVQEYELAGRKTFVPVIAFNALYEWSGGKAQSSAAYLVGRDTRQDKLGPLRLDQGAREFRELGARPLPAAVRT